MLWVRKELVQALLILWGLNRPGGLSPSEQVTNTPQHLTEPLQNRAAEPSFAFSPPHFPVHLCIPLPRSCVALHTATSLLYGLGQTEC